MDVLAQLSIPVAEVSGLCLGGGRLYAVGDRGDGIAHCPAGPDGRLGEWEVLAAEDIDGWDLTQVEAVAAIGGDRVVVVCEEPSVAAVVDIAARRVVQRTHLAVPKHHPLHKSWVKEANSRVEGVMLLQGGGMLAAKEKRPTGLMIFGPVGDFLADDGAYDLPPELTADRWWSPADDLKDVSDLAVAPDGSLAVLSDASRAIGLLARPFPDSPDLAFAQVHALPKSVDKPEGLVWLTPGIVAVASDTKHARDNLVLLAWR